MTSIARLACVAGVAATSLLVHATAPQVQATSAPAGEAKPFTEHLKAAAFKFEMMPIPGDEAKGIKPFYMASTELTWEAFDCFAYALDAGGNKEEGAPVEDIEEDENPPEGFDVVTRPSKPYLPPDRGFGHEGYAAICISGKSAAEFCKWISVKTGRHYRLPTVQEWEHASRAGTTTKYSFGDDASKLGDYAWFADNSKESPQKVGSKKPNAWGLFDMHGNVLEWATRGDGKKPVGMGGSWRDPADKLVSGAFQEQDSSWNATDPQVPKSKWWLSDGSFIGFRIVCDAAEAPKADAAPAAEDAAKKSQ
jgi:formylglycine-generating enzyme required for sulfatase activity